MKKSGFCLFLTVFAGFSLFAFDDGELFYRAERSFETGDYAAALTDYEELIRRYPLSEYLPDAQFRRAVALFRLQRPEESLRLFLRVRERYPSGVFTQTLPFWLGMNYYELGDYAAAEAELSDYAKTAGGEFQKEALLTLAFACYRNGNDKAALETALRLSDISLDAEDEPQALALIFSLFLKFKEYDKLVRFSQTYDLSRLPPEFRCELSYYRAEALFFLKEYEKAAADYLYCLEGCGGGTAAGAAQRLFSIYRIRRDYDSLNRLMDSAETRFADKPEVVNALRLKYGVEKFKLKRYDEAILWLNRIWTNEPTSSMSDLVPLYLAQAFAAENQPQRAFETLYQYRGEAKEFPALILFLTARYGAETQRWPETEAAAEEFLKADADTDQKETAVFFLVLSLIRQQRFDDAKKTADFWEAELPNLKSRQRFLRLKLEIAEATDDLNYSVQSLDSYLRNSTGDDQAVFDFVSRNFKAEKFTELLEYTDGLMGDRPRLEAENPPLSVFIRYMRALSFISLKRYSEAAAEFELISPEMLMRNGWDELIPYYLYYRGWACYREGNYAEALTCFSDYAAENPEGEFYAQALYLCGWSAYSLKNYEEAADWFLSYAEIEQSGTRLTAALTAGKSYAAAGLNDRAEEVFTAVAASAPESVRIEALYEYALLLQKTGYPDRSAEIFNRIFKENPGAPESENALLNAAEIYLERERVNDAVLAYTDFVSAYPDSPQRLPALAQLCRLLFESERNAEAVRVLAQWSSADRENLYDAERLLLRARLAMRMKAWEEADAAWNELLRRFPEEAQRSDARLQIAKLYYLSLGQSDEEAELSIQFSRGGGLESEEGRRAAVELAAIYFRDRKNRSEEALNSRALLEELIRNHSVDTVNAAAARFELGWLAYDEKRYADALPLLMEAVTADGTAAFVPEALLKAGTAALHENSRRDADELFSRLKNRFPNSEWTKQIPGRRP